MKTFTRILCVVLFAAELAASFIHAEEASPATPGPAANVAPAAQPDPAVSGSTKPAGKTGKAGKRARAAKPEVVQADRDEKVAARARMRERKREMERASNWLKP